MLPFTMWWVRHNEKIALRMGRKLTGEEWQWADQIGISQPEKIRILSVAKIPTSLPHFIERFLQQRGYPAGTATGMCMRYGIYVKETEAHRKSLIAHEMVHTHQFERHGELWQFLKKYLTETMILGYANSPLEIEANNKAETLLA